MQGRGKQRASDQLFSSPLPTKDALLSRNLIETAGPQEENLPCCSFNELFNETHTQEVIIS